MNAQNFPDIKWKRNVAKFFIASILRRFDDTLAGTLVLIEKQYLQDVYSGYIYALSE